VLAMTDRARFRLPFLLRFGLRVPLRFLLCFPPAAGRGGGIAGCVSDFARPRFLAINRAAGGNRV
jgi:hypothetical protein